MSKNKLKDRLSISKDDRKRYTEIKSDEKIKSDGDLKGLDNVDLFFISMMIGFYILGKREPISRKDGYVKEAQLKKDNWHIIKSVAVHENNSMEILENKNEMFTIAEEYANAGIKRLYEWYYENEHDFIERIEEFLIEAYDYQRIGE